MQKQILQKTKKWPEDWEKHILNTCKLYFDNKTIEFTDGSTIYSYIAHVLQKYETMSLTIKFNIKGKTYEANVMRQNIKGKDISNNMVRTCIVYIEDVKEDDSQVDDQENHYLFKTNIGYLVLHPIASFYCQTGYDCAINIEKIIIKDYDNRNNNDGGGGRNEPIEPFVPSDSLNLDPILSSD